MEQRIQTPERTRSLPASVSLPLLLAVSLLIAAALAYWTDNLRFSESRPHASVMVRVSTGSTAEGIGKKVGGALLWTEAEKRDFPRTFQSIQWDAFNEALASLLSEEFFWSAEEREQFLIRGTAILNETENIFEDAYIPRLYTFPSEAAPAVVAEILTQEVLNVHGNDLEGFFRTKLSFSQRRAIDALMKAHQNNASISVTDRISSASSTAEVLLPDLVPLSPQDVSIRERDGRTLLVFSTTYYNIGDGALELVADSATAGIQADIERAVFQRTYRGDGTYIDEPVGTFLWHDEHLHYHFSDFVEYILEPAESNAGMAAAVGQKATYCVRDISRVEFNNMPHDIPAAYRICGKERQGVSVGWGDTYFHTYDDQYVDITHLPSGEYRLSFIVNPAGHIKETSPANNVSSALLAIDKETKTVTVLSREPKEAPRFEHVYIEQDL